VARRCGQVWEGRRCVCPVAALQAGTAKAWNFLNFTERYGISFKTQKVGKVPKDITHWTAKKY
jgi:hypothetical protein